MRTVQLLVLAAAMALGAAAALAQDREPDWLRRPTSDDIKAVWPREAYRKGLGGKAVIGCVVTVQGALRNCTILSEQPAGGGFGNAGLALTPQFVMRPALKAGVPVEGAVRIPLTFPQFTPSTEALPPSKGTLVYTQLPWRKAPTFAEVLAAYPAKARAARVGGAAAIDCRIQEDGHVANCRSLKETPTGYGFFAAAKSLAPLFVTPTTTTDTHASIVGSRAHLTVTFAAGALDTPTPVIGRPKWVAVPAINDLAAVLPPEARKASVYKARVMMACSVVAEGAVDGCVVSSEDPAGLGYGAAAVKLSHYFRLAVWTDEGLPTVGGTVTIPLRFDLESAVAAAGH